MAVYQFATSTETFFTSPAHVRLSENELITPNVYPYSAGKTSPGILRGHKQCY